MKLFLTLFLLILTACARPSPAPPAGETIIAGTVAADWSAQGIWHLRTSALFELRGAGMPVNGFLRLDTSKREARLVGINDLGVKMFDLSVTSGGEEMHFLLPELERFPRLDEAIALSVRRIFLAPRPTAADGLSSRGEEWRLERRENGSTYYFHLDSRELLLLEKGVSGREGKWRISYHEYRPVEGAAVPGMIVLDDFRAGYRLTLWVDEAKRSDE